MRRGAGFTLIELVIVIAISAIVSTFIFRNIAAPIEGFADLSRRARLVDVAETALARMTREIRLALPNSVRVTAGGQSLEFLRTLTGGRYRADVDPGDPLSDPIDFAFTADSFDVLGPLDGNLAAEVSGGAGGVDDCLNGSSDCLVIFNTGQPADCAAQPQPQRTNAYCGDNLAGVVAVTPAQVSFDASGAAGSPFQFGSPGQRFHIVDTPVSFVCSGVTLERHAGYAITPAQQAAPGGSVALLANRVGACSFRYDPGTATRAGVVTIALTIREGSETVTLLQQVHVPNVP